MRALSWIILVLLLTSPIAFFLNSYSPQYALMFLLIMLASASWSFAESGIEGPNNINKRKYGFYTLGSLRISKYHLWLAFTWLVMLSIPVILATEGRIKMLALTVFAASLGAVIEDFGYYVNNPFFGLDKFNPAKTKNISWERILGIHVPKFYLMMSTVSLAALVWFLYLTA